MAITIGLDFGTHQTKICVENSDDPHHITYELWKWEDGSYVLPSIIQINKDKTLSYGRINIENCLTGKKYGLEEPTLDLPHSPIKPDLADYDIKDLPPEPYAEVNLDESSKKVPYSQLYGIKKYSPKEEYEEFQLWLENCEEIDEIFDNIKESLERLKDLCPEFEYELPTKPAYPDEPFLEGYDYNYDPRLEASKEQRREYGTWRHKCFMLEMRNKENLAKYNEDMEIYKLAYKDWEQCCLKKEKKFKKFKERISNEPLIYRYFKQATFSDYSWVENISPEDLTVLYLSFVIFNLENRFKDRFFSIQIGVPSGEKNFEDKKKLATVCIIKAYKLVEEIFERNMEKFLSTPYDQLLSLIPNVKYSDEIKEDYGVIVLPEAFAALSALTSRSRIPNGMNVMLDFGGGTTDISFFTIQDDGDPLIHHYESVSKGINFFLEYGVEKYELKNRLSLDNVPYIEFHQAFYDYQEEIKKVVISIQKSLYSEITATNITKNMLKNALINRPLIYTGGGSSYKNLRIEYPPFEDIIYCDKEILNLMNIKEESGIDIPYSIFATAFGLSIARIHDDINSNLSSLEDFFFNYRKDNNNKHRYEHGFSDI